MKILLPIILIVVSVALFFMQVNPIYTEVKQLRAEAKQYDEALVIAQELQALRTELTKTLESFSDEDLARLDHFLPRRLDTVRIILDIDGIAKQSNVSLENLKIDEIERAPAASSGSQGNIPGYPGLSSIGASFSFSATYSQAILFMRELEKSLRLFETTMLTIKPAANSTNVYEFGMTINTFWINR